MKLQKCVKMKPGQQISLRHEIHYTAPALRWDEGLPCGNGLLGLLVWGDPATAGLNLSVDRSDLWDNRPYPTTQSKDFCWKTLVKFLDRNDMQSVWDKFESWTDVPHPTKLPCGRFTLDFDRKQEATFDSRLDLAKATTTTRIGRTVVTAYVHAVRPLIVIRIRGGRPRAQFLSPFDRSRPRPQSSVDSAAGPDVACLGYPPPRHGRGRGGARYVLQRCAEGFSYTVAWKSMLKRGERIFYLTVQQAGEDRDPVPLALRTLKEAGAIGPAQLERTHVVWWRNYWRKGHVRLPDECVERLWYVEMYKLAAAARKGAPPISLQGVWSADEMRIPPWHGDYHHDLNTEITYWPVHTAGRIEQSEAFADWLLKWLPTYQAFARDFYNAPGANVPGSHSLSGAIVPGWAAFVYSRANGCWLIQHLWWHYRYTMDQEFLRDTAYPFIREIARFVVSQLKKDSKGVYHIHYSSSPEVNDNRRESFAIDSTYDLSLIRYALQTAAAAARILNAGREEAKQWQTISIRLPCYARSPRGGLACWKGQPLVQSHLHFSHLMPIFPLGEVTVENGDEDRVLIQNSLGDLERSGTGAWLGFSYSWLACLAARIREPNRVLWALNQYLDAFVSPNSFHLNGDYKKLGASNSHYRPFTLEGNFAAAHAVNEMLLQSWGGRIRIFPAVPADWRDVAFTELRAEGAFVISAWRGNGAFQRAKIISEKGQPICVEHPCPDWPVLVQELGRAKRRRFLPGKDLRFPTRPGGRYVLARL